MIVLDELPVEPGQLTEQPLVEAFEEDATIIAQDPDVIRRIAGWHWQPGLRPKPNAPVWRMDSFRNRFFDAYGTGNWLPLGD